MCGRFTLKANAAEFGKEFGVSIPPGFKVESYNIAPSQALPIIHLDPTQERHVSLMEWGLLPPWAKDVKDTPRPINARLETVNSSPMFKSAFQKRRCLVPASGFYEWSAKSSPKQPYYFYEGDRSLFAFAGLWSIWEKEAEIIHSFTMITKEAEGVIKPVHGRMPVILNKEDYESWLAGALLPKKSPSLTCHAVSLKVNTPKHNDESLIAEVIH